MNVEIQLKRHDSTDLVLVARTDELSDNAIKAVQIEGVELIIIRHADDISIFHGRCPHQGTLLSEGTIQDGILTCRGHGWQFACPSGCKIGESALQLKRFDVIVDDREVKVDRSEVFAWKAQRQLEPYEITSQPPAISVRSLAQLPGPKGIPVLGNILQMAPEKLHLVLEQWCRKFGPVYTYNLMGRPFVGIADPVLIGRILRERPGTYRRWDVIETVAQELGINGVFSTEGETWRRQRQLVAKALDPEHLRAFFPTLCTMTRRLMQRWEKAAREHESVDIQKDLMRYTVDVTTNLAFGYDMDTLESEGEVIQRHLEVVFPMINRRINAPFPYWHYFKLPADRELNRALTVVQQLTRDLITANRARLARRSEFDSRPANLLEALLTAQHEGQRPLTDDEVLANVFTILLAGEDTTANAIAWVAYFMSCRPEIQRKMQDEVDSIIGTRSMLEDMEEGNALVYLDAVTHEAMRLKSVAPVIGVEPIHDVEVGGIAIPKGTVLALLTRQAGLQQRGGSAVQEFDPDRWLSRASAASHHQAGFMPFGSGPRLCPGRSLALMEVRSAVAMLCRNFNISLATDPSEVEERFAFSMMPRNLRVIFNRRI
ncbi:cytochrome P450 [Burkholderia sp. SRS-W-2-2016]|uniref:cytochrome P450 n=1 Tax=Burkholderia sp. SRS-W-2-2016 TaxID=1926878 RepID=UPI00094B6003|nr:cytochrome P450 [Burkholderia sp. SRS-W-2-2016]OLL32695.1 cytochrome P450 [Burkholderia sp. SRS-W-2-2016]